MSQPPSPLAPHDLRLDIGGSALSRAVASGTLPAVDAASRVAALLLQEAEKIMRGERKVVLSSPYEARVLDQALVDSLEFQRVAIEMALQEREKQISSTTLDPSLQDVVIYGGPRSMTLARQVSVYLGMTLGNLEFHRFPDSEFKFEVKDSVRNKHVYVVMSTGNPAAENTLSLCVLADALFRAKAASITAVLPLCGFARQDRRDKGKREPITAELFARLLEKSGVGSTITLDLHAPQEEGFFKRLDALYASSVMVPWVRQYIDPAQSIMLAPDAGSIKRAEHYGELLGIAETPVWIHKTRKGDSEVKASKLAGSVKGKTVIISDDLISTAGTIVEAAKLAMDKHAREVIVVATHPVMASNAYEKLSRAPIKKVILADTLPIQFPVSEKFEIVPSAPLLAEAIRRDHTGGSVSELLSKTFELKELLAPWLSYNPLLALKK